MTVEYWAFVSRYYYFVETMSVCRTVYEIFSVKEWRDLETVRRGLSRSLKMAPFSRPYTTSYWSAVVNIALSATVFELFDVEWRRNLEIRVRGYSRLFKLVTFESLGAVSYSSSIVTMALSCISSEIKRGTGLKSWFFHTPFVFDAPVQGVPVLILPSRLVRKN